MPSAHSDFGEPSDDLALRHTRSTGDIYHEANALGQSRNGSGSTPVLTSDMQVSPFLPGKHREVERVDIGTWRTGYASPFTNCFRRRKLAAAAATASADEEEDLCVRPVKRGLSTNPRLVARLPRGMVDRVDG